MDTQKMLNHLLVTLSRSLTIPEEMLSECNEYMQKIFLILQQKSRYKLDRSRLAGGVAKKTSIAYSFDYDCVIYVNNEDPPFKNILDEWEDILTLQSAIPVESPRLTQCSIQFSIKGFAYDLLPAPNYATANQDIHQQANTIWNKIRSSRSTNVGHLYSSGLSELAVQFAKKQSAFIHDLCRLAKFWNGTVLYEGYVSGRSSIIEYLAVKGGQEEEQAGLNGSLSLLRAFRRFLALLTEHQSIGIVFYDFYLENLVPEYQKPFLIDPSNPFNNLLNGIAAEFLPTLSGYARETLARLDRCERCLSGEGERLFYPQPDLRQLFANKVDVRTVHTIISSYQNCEEKSPRLIVRRETFDARALENMKQLMASVLQHVIATVHVKSEESNLNEITKAAQHLMDRSFYGKEHIWSITTETHENFDITFILPLHTKNRDALRISLSK
jgi:hypothetical protein